jgi:hypothetical protein
VLVKDRWVGPREQVLNVPIIGQRYGPGKPSSWLSTEVFSSLLHWLLWEISWVRTHGPINRRAVAWVGSHSSWEQWICSNLLTTMQKVDMHWPRDIRIVWDHTRTECGMRVVCWLGFPYRVYIDSNCRNSRKPLICDHRHIDNLMTWMMVYNGIALRNYLHCYLLFGLVQDYLA